MGELCEDDTYRDLFTSQLNPVAGFLECNPDYRGISGLEIDLNLIEVSIQNTCFSYYFSRYFAMPVLRRTSFFIFLVE